MNALAPFGFYGWGNIGDESTLQGFARLVSLHGRGLRVWVSSQNPAHTRKVEPSFKYFRAGEDSLRARWARRTSKAHVIAGGTPIMDNLGDWPLCELVPLVQSAVRSRRPFACVGIGVETLREERSRLLVTSELAPHVVHWSVRSDRDRGRLESLGVPPARITVAADMAWLLSPVDSDFGRRTISRFTPGSDRRILVGVNINFERAMAAQQPRLKAIVAGALDRLLDTVDARVLFLCNEIREGETFDKATAQSILALMKQRDHAAIVPNEYFTPQQMLSLIGCCDLTISSRYHFCLFSALQGVPFLALNRSDKVEDLCLDLHWPHALHLSDLDADHLCDLMTDLRRNRQALSPVLAEQVGHLRNRAGENVTALEALVGSDSRKGVLERSS
jgi:polysaccharide pyruvyl transferase WcaK-like protein